MAEQEDASRVVEEQDYFTPGLEVTPEFLDIWRRTAARHELGHKLEHMRRDAGLTQADLAERMGKKQAFVARVESGRGDMPKAENVALYAAKCGFATAYAFVQMSADDGLTLHELQPIRQHEAVAARLEAVHDVVLPTGEFVAEK